MDTQLLKEWFVEQKRDLPWRDAPSPYAVWISEIMLQQTQVSVVEDYFYRWMQRFPTVRALADASLEDVLKMWEGLGYYSRARHVHAAARYFCERHNGNIPSEREALEKVKGLGPYTIGAILSFAFHQRAAAVDANVARVLARFYCIEEDISQGDVRKKIWDIAESILPDEEPWMVVEGLIELGAMVCTRQPKCHLCPLRRGCTALRQEKQMSVPLKKKAKEITLIQRHVTVIHCNGEWLLKKGSPRGLMADLYEFPYFDKREELEAIMQERFAFPVKFEKTLDPQCHSFTRYKAHLFPTLWKALEKKSMPEYHWFSWEKMRGLPFSSGHRRILNNLLQI